MTPVSTFPLLEGQPELCPLTLQLQEVATLLVSLSGGTAHDQKEPLMSKTAIAPADVVRRYFELDADRDIDSLVALFSDDATVVDEGETRHGTAEIRAWQIGPASKYTYNTEVLGTVPLDAGRYVVTGRLTGNFPGGTAELTWDFTVARGRIRRLVIAP
jgi:hypothetical protein